MNSTPKIFNFIGIIVFILISPLSTKAFAEERTIDGEVFIVKQDAQNIRLGLVPIKIFSEDVITNYVASRFKLAPAETPESFDQLIKASEESIEKQKIIIEEAKEAEKKFSTERGQGIRDSIKTCEKFIASLEAVKNTAIKKKKTWPHAAYFFKELPDTKFSTLTDADGKFKMVIPHGGKFAVSAHASRKISEKITEDYFWLVWISSEETAKDKILLANHNLMTSDSKESVISTKY